MRLAHIWLLAAVAALALKLFTYEYYLADDPTCGIAARLRPSMVSHQLLHRGDLVLLSDENRFLGAWLYEAMVNWGYLAVIAAGPICWYARKQRGSPSI
ncbi:MAG: hypothetical protein IT165_23760 [Bryobacterales bacterium]|nr:hypothetical protein [Bryobacterales bacterium]